MHARQSKWLPPTGSAICIGRRFVVKTAISSEWPVRDVVRSSHHRLRQRRNGRGQDLIVGAEVSKNLGFEGQDFAVVVYADIDVIDLTATVRGC